jgi:hypothetical protein
MGVLTLEKNEIAALLESLCDRPFADDPDGASPTMADMAGRTAPGRSGAPGRERAGANAEDPRGATVALASILSGTATAAEGHGFQEAAIASSAVRLEAQSALAFIDGIEQAPSGAPAHLVDAALASAGGGRRRPLDASQRRPSIWSRISGIRIGARRGGVAAAGAMLIMAGGVSWSLISRHGAAPQDRVAVPAATNPVDAPPVIPEAVKPEPGLEPVPDPIPAPPPAPMSAPISAPVPAQTAAPAGTPAQARADPCETRSAAGLEPPPTTTADAAKRAPSRPQRKTAAVADPGCPDAGATEAGLNPKTDQAPVQAPVHAVRPGSQVGGLDRHRPTAALSVPRSAPAAAPAKPPRPNPPPR